MATIDERVVEMRFDNKDFEKNVQTSLKTIDKLKDSLDFDDAAKSLDDLQDAAKHFSLDDIGEALRDLSDKFSWENILKVDLLRRTLDIVQNEVKRAFTAVSQALMLDQVDWVKNMSLGWGKFGEKTQSVATIMSATGDSMETVNAQMEKLMFFTDETSYNFTDMASNIGKFTANGVALEDSVSAMEGIANWAARSGQEAAAASRVMYNLSQAIGMGSLKLQDWKSIELANMGTKEFKEVAINAGLASGTLEQMGDKIIVTATKAKKAVQEVSVNNFRETLKEGWMDTETLMATLNEYGKASDLIAQINSSTGLWTMNMKDIIEGFRSGSYDMNQFLDDLEEGLSDNGRSIDDLSVSLQELYEQFKLLSSAEYEFSLEAYYAGQEARTFEAAMKSVSDAVSSGWMRTFELIFGQYEEAKELWSDLAENLFEIFRPGIDARNALLEDAGKSGWDQMTDAIKRAGVSMDDFDRALIEASGLTRSGFDFQEVIKEYGSVTDAIQQGAFGIDEGIRIVKDAIGMLQGTEAGAEGIQEVTNSLGLSYEELEKYGEEVRSGMYGWYTSEEQVQRIMEANADLTKEQAEMIVKYAEAQHEVHRGLSEEEYREWLALHDIAEEYSNVIGKEVELSDLTEEQQEALRKYADRIYIQGARKSFREGLINVGHTAVEVVSQLRDVIQELIPPITAERIADLAQQFKNATEKTRDFIENSETIKNIAAVIIGPIGFIFQILKGIAKVALSLAKVLGLLLSPVVALINFVGWIIRQVNNLTGGFNPILSILEGISRALNAFTSYIQRVIDVVAPIVKEKLLSKIEGPLASIKERLDAFKESKSNIFNKLIEDLEKKDPFPAAEKIIGFLSTIWNLLRKVKNGGFAAIGDGFSNLMSKLGPIGKFFPKLSGSIQDFIKKFEITKRGIKQTYAAMGENISGWKAGLLAIKALTGVSFSGLKDKVLGPISDAIGKVVDKFNITKKGIKQTYAALGQNISGWKAGLLAIKVLASDAFERLKDKIFGTSEAGQALRAKFESIGTTIGAVKDKIIAKLAEIRDAIVAWITGEKVDFSSIFKFEKGEKTLTERFTEVKEKLASIFKGGEDGEGGIFSGLFGEEGFDFSKLLKGGAIAGGLAMIAKLFLGIKRTKDAVEGKDNGAVLGGFAEGISPLAGTIEELKTALSGFSILKFAVAMVALAWALSKLGELSVTDMGVTLGTLGGALVEFIGTFAIISKVLGGKNGVAMIKIGFGMLAVTWALRSFAKVIESFKNLHFESVRQIVKVLAVLFLAILTFSRIAKVAGKFNFKLSNGLGLIAAAGALWLFGKVLNSYTKLKINSENILKVLGGMLLAVVVMSRLAKVAGKNNFKFSNGLALISLALSLSMFAGVIRKLSKMDPGALTKGLISVEILSLIVSALIKRIAEPLKEFKLTNAIAGLIIIASLLAMMITVAGLCFVLGKLDSSVLGVGALAIIIELGIIVLAMKTLVKSLEDFKLGSAIGGLLMMIGMIALLVAFTAAIMVLGEWGTRNPESYLRGLIAIAVIIGGFLAVALVLKNASTGKLIVAILGLLAAAAAMWVAVLAIEKLAKIDGKKAIEGVKAIGLLLAEFLAMAAINTALPIVIIGEIATVVFMKELAEAIEPLVAQLGKLSDMHPENVAKGIENIQKIIDLFFDLAKRLATNANLYSEGKQAAELAKIFGESLRPLCDDTAILGGTDPDAAAANLEVVRGLINTILELAQLLTDNADLYAQATSAANLARIFGESLKPLCDDTAILGGVNPENAVGALGVVRGLIDTMLELADKLIQNAGLFVAGMAASTLAKAFGEGLEQLCNDVVILGSNQSAETSLDSIATVQGLIDVMVGLATLLNDNAWLFAVGQLAADIAGQFGVGLKQLCEDVVILGGTESAETSLKSVSTVWALIQVMCNLAKKLNKDQEILASAQDASNVAAAFGAGLEGLCKDVEVLGKVNIENASGNLELLLTAIGKMWDIANDIRDDGEMYEAGVDTAKLVKKFAWSLFLMTGEVFALGKVNSGDAIQTDGEGNITGGGFAAVAAIIDYMLTLAKKVSEDEGLFEKADSAAAMCKKFGESLAFLVAEGFISQFIDNEAAAKVDDNGKITDGGFAAVAAIIDYMVDLASKFSLVNGTLFFTAGLAASACKKFGESLVPLVTETFALGFVNAANAKTNFETIQIMLTYLTDMAIKFKRNPGVFDKAAELTAEGGVIRSFAGALAGLVVDVILASFADAEDAKASIEAMQQMVTMLTDLATTINDNSGMGDSLATATTILKEFGDNMAYITAGARELHYGNISSDDLTDVLDSVQGFITGVLALEGDANAAANAIRGVADLFQSITTLSGNQKALKLFADDDFKTGLHNVLDEITTVVKALQELGDISNASSALWGLGNIFETLGDILFLAAGDSDFSAAVEGYMGDAEKIITQAVTDIQEALAAIDFSSFDDAVLAFKATTLVSMESFGSEILTYISSGITNNIGSVSSALIEVMKNGTSTINGWSSSYYNAGYNVIIGFNNGIVAGASTVYNNVRTIANSVVNIMKGIFKEHSPSRVFAEIGEYTMLGLAKGIEDTGIQPIDAVETLGDNLIDAMRNAMAYANEVDYGVAPTITPVMDMSQMSTQSSMLRSAMGNFDMHGMIANANIDGATINNSIQSKDIIAEIRQLNERLTAMDENLQNMQLVLDTGALVGGTSVAMDNQFGKMAMRRGRGN